MSNSQKKGIHQAHKNTVAQGKQFMEEDVFQKIKRKPGSSGSGRNKENQRVENDGAEEP